MTLVLRELEKFARVMLLLPVLIYTAVRKETEEEWLRRKYPNLHTRDWQD